MPNELTGSYWTLVLLQAVCDAVDKAVIRVLKINTIKLVLQARAKFIMKLKLMGSGLRINANPRLILKNVVKSSAINLAFLLKLHLSSSVTS